MVDVVDQDVDQGVDDVVDQPGAAVVTAPGEAELVVEAAGRRRTVDLAVRVGPGWWLVQHERDGVDAGLWRVEHDGVHVGWVRQSATTRGRRGWQARLADGTQVPAGGRLAVAAGSVLWRSRDLAAAAIAQRQA